ncbi:MAG: hypothetical protein GY784_07505 [Gammaproteobacteria bacterium]|nr:hypothetical protein [Gammaproteobacteria bacterium]
MSQERRRFFRIEDRVFLKTRKIKPEDLKQELEDFWANRQRHVVSNELNPYLNDRIEAFRAIQPRMPELARYLQVLQSQIDHLTRTVMPEIAPAPEQDINVNLSAQGIAFDSVEYFKPDDIFELGLTLQPSHYELTIFARVVVPRDIDSIPKNSTDPHKVALDFEFIHSADRDMLVKHINEKQILMLRARQDDDA